jgi:hypothetical protein
MRTRLRPDLTWTRIPLSSNWTSSSSGSRGRGHDLGPGLTDATDSLQGCEIGLAHFGLDPAERKASEIDRLVESEADFDFGFLAWVISTGRVLAIGTCRLVHCSASSCFLRTSSHRPYPGPHPCFHEASSSRRSR